MISSLVLAPFAFGSLRRLPRRGYRRRGRRRRAARHRLRLPDGRSRAHDGGQHGLHHRPVRRVHAAPRPRRLRDARAARAVARHRARGRRPAPPQRRSRRVDARERARPRERRLPGAADHRHGAIRTALRPACPDVPADGDLGGRVHRHRALPRRARGAPRVDGLGRTRRHRSLRRSPRLLHRDLGAGADHCRPRRARLHPRSPVRSTRRRPPRRRGARLGRLGRLRGHDGRHPRGRAGGGRDPPSLLAQRRSAPRDARSCSGRRPRSCSAR